MQIIFSLRCISYGQFSYLHCTSTRVCTKKLNCTSNVLWYSRLCHICWNLQYPVIDKMECKSEKLQNILSQNQVTYNSNISRLTFFETTQFIFTKVRVSSKVLIFLSVVYKSFDPCSRRPCFLKKPVFDVYHCLVHHLSIIFAMN